MKQKRIAINRTAIGLSLFSGLLLFAAVPGRASILSFTGATIGGTINTSLPFGPTAAVTTFTNIPFDTLVVNGAPANNGTYALTSATESFNTGTDVLTLVGQISGLSGLTTVSTLATIDLSTGLTANTNAAGSGLNLPASVISVSLSPTLLADLGLTGDMLSLSGLGDIGQPTATPGDYTSISSTLGVNATPLSPTPEADVVVSRNARITDLFHVAEEVFKSSVTSWH